MRLPNPCPCASLQNGVAVGAGFEAGYSAFFVYEIITLLLALDVVKPNPVLPLPSAAARPIYICEVVTRIFQVLLAILLTFGAHKKLSALCWTWFGFMVVIIVLNVIFGILAQEEDFVRSMVNNLVVIGIISVIEIYLLYVVFAFIAQLRQQREQPMNSELGAPTADEAGAPEPHDYAMDTGISSFAEPTIEPQL